jgi:hypothetical protein
LKWYAPKDGGVSWANKLPASNEARFISGIVKVKPMRKLLKAWEFLASVSAIGVVANEQAWECKANTIESHPVY